MITNPPNNNSAASKIFIPTNLTISYLLAAILILIGCHSLFASDETFWRRILPSDIKDEIQCFKISPQNKNIIFIGTSKGVYRFNSSDKSLRMVLPLYGPKSAVNCLAVGASGEIFAATDQGLYQSAGTGERWNQVFFAAGQLEKQCFWVAAHDGEIYIATAGGLFYKGKESSVWEKKKDELGRAAVFFVDIVGKDVYAVLKNEVLRLDKTSGEIAKVFSVVAAASEETAQDSDIESDNAIEEKQIYFLTHDNQSDACVYLAAATGIFKSCDGAKSWEKVGANGLPYSDVTALAVDAEKGVFTATHKGVFRYLGGHWSQLFEGLDTNEVNFIATDDEKNIYAAAGSNIFFLEEKKALSAALREGRTFDFEPPISHVQKMAIDYAEVNPDKIKGWRRAARNKGWLPTVSVGMDRSASELLHWDSGPSPDNLLKGKDFVDWDVSLSWDLGDLVWNADQTSIDSRSKLMVELREDVLDQVTRLYFERRRLQRELLILENIPEVEKLDKVSRVEELTALIDGFTGGEFSRKINKEKDVRHD